MKMLITALVLSLALSSPSFAKHKRCQDVSGKFTKCPAATASPVPAASVVPTPAVPVTPTQAVTQTVPAPAKEVAPGITMTTTTTKTGKAVTRCRNTKTGKFAKCPKT